MKKFKGKTPDYFWDFNDDATQINVFTDSSIQNDPIRSFTCTEDRDDEGNILAVSAAESFIKDLREGREILKNWLTA